VEAAACGTPVIATPASPLPGLLQGGGIFVKPGDAGEVEAAMRRLLDDEPLRAAMGQIARKAGALSWERGAEVALGRSREAA
jgi:glycosyltransferase involved in cell wall biosynthesis